MSRHAKKLKRAEDWAGGPFPVIDVDTVSGEPWLYWNYQMAPYQVRVEIPLMPFTNVPWLYVDGDPASIGDGDAVFDAKAEANYGAMTRVRLLQAHADDIRTDEAAGLSRLRAAATTAGLYGKRESRRCVVPTWTRVP